MELLRTGASSETEPKENEYPLAVVDHHETIILKKQTKTKQKNIRHNDVCQ